MIYGSAFVSFHPSLLISLQVDFICVQLENCDLELQASFELTRVRAVNNLITN